MARALKVTTTTGAVSAALLAGGSASVFYGVYASSAEAAGGLNIKLYWEGTGTAPPSIGGVQPTTTLPVAGTTVPSLTVSVPQTGLTLGSPIPVNNGGRIWYWITGTAADNSTTALATGGDVITFVYD
jgi:hypothetical protein